jgi:hypothetical protein
MQTDLKSDDFCGYNISASEFYWTLQPGQYNNTYVMGEVGVGFQGGGPGSYIRPDVVDISSFLSGRNDNLSKCSPPVPSLDALNEPPLHLQETSTEFLVPLYTKEKRSAVELDSVDYNRWVPLYTDPQNLRHVIEETSPAQRGGLSTQLYTKAAWNQENFNNIPNNRNRNFNNNRAKLCQTTLDPARFFPGSEGITGYPGVNPLTGKKMDVTYTPPNKPPNDPNYPWKDITAQQLYDVGAAPCGPSFFSGKNYDVGSCPQVEQTMFLDYDVEGPSAYNS